MILWNNIDMESSKEEYTILINSNQKDIIWYKIISLLRDCYGLSGCFWQPFTLGLDLGLNQLGSAQCHLADLDSSTIIPHHSILWWYHIISLTDGSNTLVV